MLSIMHIALAAVSLAVNGINIHIRRSALPMILIILTFLVMVVSLINAVYFDSHLPLVLGCASVPVSFILALAVWLLRTGIQRKR